METGLEINVAHLDAPHRRALEEVVGCPLDSRQRLVISVLEITTPVATDPRPVQTLEDWTRVYEGLSHEEIDAID